MGKKILQLQVFTAFRSRNYRLYVYGQSISLMGTWMQRTAVSWVVYVLTHSTFMLGLSLFCTQFPSFMLTTIGGVVSDRYNRYKVMLTTQIASLVQSFFLFLIVWRGNFNVWEILGMGVVLGTINAFDVPARQSLVYEMVDKKENLPNALALNSSMVNLARLIGPAIAGFVLHKLGNATCFLLNSLSFLAVIVSLLRMRLPRYVRAPHEKKVLGDLKAGWTYLVRHPGIGRPILMLALMSLLVIPFATLLPVYAKVIFHGNATTFGLIDSFIGLGAISCALWLAGRNVSTETAMKKTLRINTIIFGVGLILFSHSAWFPMAMLFAVITGFGMMAETTMTNTIIQTAVAPEMRGRVISYFAMAYFGMMPLGSLLVGFISQYAGAQNTLMGQGVIALAIVGLFWKHLTAASPGAAVQPNGTAPTSATNAVKHNTTQSTWKQTAKL
ncbi:MAG TPA: MFS transporter [Puia sp.]|nr:MFS transporter [Puia sp.]